MRTALLLALLVGCADDAGPHDLVECEGWFGFDRCERACAVMDDVSPSECPLLGGTCVGWCPQIRNDCAGGIDVDGVVGCCSIRGDNVPPGEPPDFTIRWEPCE